MKTGRCVRCPRANGAPLLGSRLMGKDSGGRWRLRTAKPPYRRRSRAECSDSNSLPASRLMLRVRPPRPVGAFVGICTIRGFCGQGATNARALDGRGDELQFETLAPFS